MNLWLRDLASGETRRLTDADCNPTEPAWAVDSKTLAFFALSRRRVVP